MSNVSADLRYIYFKLLNIQIKHYQSLISNFSKIEYENKFDTTTN